MEASKEFVQFIADPQCQRLWEEADDVVLLELLADMNMRISPMRTIVATGVIAVVQADLNRIPVRAYSGKEVVRRISFMKSRFLDFESFKSIPGILFNDVTNVVTAGHDYHMNVDAANENAKHVKFRRDGEPLYQKLKDIFNGPGIANVDLQWVYAYFNDLEEALVTMSLFP